ncbi:hypothetical protein BJ742DRAFT_680798 [Cladochytrium replicatum]|nr:hypothetical protein BJ742DRAFT_680798 [Cladochytrium replicatum]
MANETFFEDKVKQGLTKLNENPQYAALFDLIMPFDFQDAEAVSQLQGKIRMKELVELLKRVINAVSENNALVLVFHETHWVDTLSWEFIVDIINGCPKTMVCIFSRSERYYESEDTRNIFIKTKRMSRCQAFSIEGMSLEETKQLIISTWQSSSMRGVSPQLAENIYKRTSGNPLFIRSLVVALKESGQWRISDSGELQTGDFDFDQVVLGSDLQSIIVAQFDRLDRNFQLFLKVASVLGQRFLLDDVLFFLVDMTGFSEKFDRRNVAQITRHIDMVDKYGYLQRVEGDQDGLFFQFKSAVVRKGIYNMMVMSQRQQLHLNVALYYEKVLNESNKHRLLIPLYEHYIETDENQNRKKIKYLERVAHFYYEKQSVAEAIKHYSLLLETVEVLYNKGVILFERFKVAVWHREIGESYFSRMDYAKAETHLLESIKLVDHPFPEGKFKLDWEIRKQRSHRVRFSVGGTGDSFKNLRGDDAGSSLLFSPPLLQGVAISAIQAPSVNYLNPGNANPSVTGGMELDLLRSWTTGKSSSAINGGPNQSHSQSPGALNQYPRVVSQTITPAGETRDNRAQSIAQAPGTLGHQHQGAAGQIQSGGEDERQDLEACLQDKAMAVLHHVRLTLLILSQLYLILENPKRHKYAVITGLNISERFPKGSLYAKYLALAGSAFWLMDRRKGASMRYLEAADRYDRRIDLTATSSIILCQSQTLFLLGAWEAAFSRYELLSQLSSVTGEFSVREEALRMKALIIFQKGTRSLSLSVSRHLYTLASQEDHWLGKFWGSFFVICNLLGSSNSVGELQDMTKTIKSLWAHEHGEQHVESPALITAYQSILSESEFRLGLGLNLNKLLQELESAASRLNPHHWIAIFPLIQLANTLFAANDTGSLANPTQRQLVVRFCLVLERSLKRMDVLCANQLVRYMFKGFRLVCAGTTAQGALSSRAKQKAVRQWEKALAVPIANELSYIKALLNFRIGRYSERGSSEASERLSEAQKEFRKLGAFYELERASAML